MESARVTLVAKRAEAGDRIAAIKATADAYLEIVDHEIVASFAQQVGLPTSAEAPARSRVELARDLRALVTELPELAPTTAVPGAPEVEAPTSPAMPIPSAPPSQASRPVAPPNSNANASANMTMNSNSNDGSRQWPQSSRPARASAPDVLALQRELDEAGLENMPDRLFLAHAEEFAARARMLQERALPEADDEAVTRIIRKLTALAHRFNLPRPVFGLSRKHSVVDWRAVADRARQQRQALLTAGSQPEAPPKPAPAKVAASVAEDDDEKDAKSEPLELPNLRRAAAHRQVLMVGGVCKNEKLERIRARTGIEVEWISLAKGSNSSTIRALSTRIGNEKIAALVFLEELMDHREYEVLIAAARKVMLPVSYGGKAGTASIERAFGEIEEQLRTGAAGAN